MIPFEIVSLSFTPLERKLVEKLADGKAHTVEEMMKWDEHSETHALNVHIHRIRRKIEYSNYRVYSGTEKGKMIYRLVTVLVPA